MSSVCFRPQLHRLIGNYQRLRWGLWHVASGGVVCALAPGAYQQHRLETWVGNITGDGKLGNLPQNDGGDGENCHLWLHVCLLHLQANAQRLSRQSKQDNVERAGHRR